MSSIAAAVCAFTARGLVIAGLAWAGAAFPFRAIGADRQEVKVWTEVKAGAYRLRADRGLARLVGKKQDHALALRQFTHPVPH